MSFNIHFDLELFLGDKRMRRALENSYNARHGQENAVTTNKVYREPWYIEICKSFFPILLIVLILRSFVAEPFRIPSASMMPTLLHGDFILVNKFAYGIRLPVMHTKILNTGSPNRGDVAVFRWPKDPSDDYIKRIIGLPGDRILYKDSTLFINGKQISQEKNGVYEGTGTNSNYNGALVVHVDLETVLHDILIKQTKFSITSGYYASSEIVVPQNHYFVMGDNRNHSSDSRSWGFVPEENLVGRAFLVWMNADFKGKNYDFKRIGKKII